MRTRQPRSTALIFNSGKLVVAGNKNQNEAKISCKKFIRIFYKLGFKVKFLDFKIQNIFCSYYMNVCLSLEKIQLYCKNFSYFEPELFPGLILKIRKATLLIFGSGKMVITGLNDYKIIQEIFNDTYLILNKSAR